MKTSPEFVQNPALQPLLSLARIIIQKLRVLPENHPTPPCQQQLPNTIRDLQLEPPQTGGREQGETLQKAAEATADVGEPTAAAHCFNQSHNTWVLSGLPETPKKVV